MTMRVCVCVCVWVSYYQTYFERENHLDVG